jgi:aspartate carbamoyltransferase catalytic subunit
MNSRKRDINSINDLENGEIEEIFALADQYCKSMGTTEKPYQVRGRRTDAKDFILATLFYEPSTRTRFSFESAMLRLGGNVLASSDPATTSASKGESLADTVRVIENYADLIVLRHPSEGAARAAAEYINIPVINGGDGSHEHPTQTLCDLYTLRSENKTIKGLNVLVVGDLKNGRTVHSLVYGLARFGANIITMPAEGLELPAEVSSRLENEFYCNPIANHEVGDFLGDGDNKTQIGAVYIASPEGQQFTLIKREGLDITSVQNKWKRKIDVCYVTRPQKERFLSDPKTLTRYPIVDKEFLQGKQYAEARVLHPLPRVSELGYELDDDPRGVYFKQAGYGVPIRMALIAKVLGIHPFRSVHTSELNAKPVYQLEAGMLCPNLKCITHSPAEQRHLSRKALIVGRGPVALRCIYCETTIPVRFIADRTKRTYALNAGTNLIADLTNAAMFEDEDQARAAGYRSESERQRA